LTKESNDSDGSGGASAATMTTRRWLE